MRLDWLEDILAVSETGSFQEAAERRHLTQSAFSRRIRSIEDHLGIELFDRSRKPVQLRPATAAQKDRIARLVTDLRQLQADLRRGDRLAERRLIIASQHALTTSLAPAILHGIQSRNEDTWLRLRSANLDECLALLLSRQADMVLAYRLPGQSHPIGADYVETLVIGTDRLMPVIGAVGQTQTAVRIAAGELPLVAYPSDVFLGQAMERRVLPRLPAGLRPAPRAETALTLAALEMALVGVAVAWVPQSLAQPRIAEGRLCDLSAQLPDQPLEVTALRLFGAQSPTLAGIWPHLGRAEGLAGGA